MPSLPTMKGDETTWWVPSDSDPSKPWIVDLETQSCDCPDFTFRGHKKKKCKHLDRAMMEFAKLKLREVMEKRGTLNQVDGP